MTSITNGVDPNLNLSKPKSARRKSLPRLFNLCTALALLLTGCTVPDHGKVWLSYTRWDKGCDSLANCSKLTDETYASSYYQTIGAEDANGNPNFNLEQWKQLFGYQNATVIRAVYGNKLDLQFGRDMNCWQPQGTNKVVCYVSNYGPAPFVNGHENDLWGAIENGVRDAGEGDIHKSFGTVAMVYDPDGLGPLHSERVGFYAFGKADDDGNSPLIRSVALDGEGAKTVPGMCMNCHSGGDHGGLYHGNSFLPFDVQSFYYSSPRYDDYFGGHSPFDLDSQQEAFRQLNALVLKAPHTPAIANMINGLYSGNVNLPGATVPDDTYIPAGWDIDKNSRNLYRHVYRKYCRTCHVSQMYNDDYKDNLAFESFSDFQKKAYEIGREVCGFRSMPNSEVPYGATYPGGYAFTPVSKFGDQGFWMDGVAKSDLRDFLSANGLGGCD
jgi:hypothetical protein